MTAGVFSVLMPLTGTADPGQFDRAIRSLHEQTLVPDEVAIVTDEALPEQLAEVIDRWHDRLGLLVIRLPERKGLGFALDQGLRGVSHEFVARMDADDIALPDRFERQIRAMEDRGLDLLGTAILEFDGDEDAPTRAVGMPIGREAIVAMMPWRNPFAHPSVVFRRSAVLAAGGYAHTAVLEDYELWARLVARGAAVDNLAEPLLLYRFDAGTYRRRTTYSAAPEVQLVRRFREYGIGNPISRSAGFLSRVGFAVAPPWLKRTSRAWDARVGSARRASGRR